MDTNVITLLSSGLNNTWVLLGAALVFFMQAGFAMCEAGFTRAKNAGNIIMKNMMDLAIGAVLYWVVGFGIMFGSQSAILERSTFSHREIIPLPCRKAFPCSRILFSRPFSAQRLQRSCPVQWQNVRSSALTVFTAHLSVS